MNKYRINFTPQFLRKYKKITKNNHKLVREVKKTLHKLANNPFAKGLKTHKYQHDYSTQITGDLRIIWNFARKQEITLFNFGGHEGKGKVYR